MKSNSNCADNDGQAYESPENSGQAPTNILALSSRASQVLRGANDSSHGADTSPCSAHSSKVLESVPVRDMPIWSKNNDTSIGPSLEARTSCSSKAIESPSSEVVTQAELSSLSRANILRDRWSWSTVPVLILAFYSTICSGIFLAIAMAKPRWGPLNGARDQISLPVATSLTTFFSKTIELSFTTVFVTLLGQVLSRRAVSSIARTATTGISIIEITMRSWITQPEALLMDWVNLHYGLTTILGGITVMAVIANTFYTTAGEALVSPKLKLGRAEDRLLAGRVSSAFANSIYLAKNCETPIAYDDQARGNTCLDVMYSGQSFGNFGSYLKTWAEKNSIGNTSITGIDGRPRPFAMLYDNTTVTGQWINPGQNNITKDSEKHRRLVQNVTMAMPHANIIHALRDERNGILQPDDKSGAGEYVVKASVPAPGLNVLCVGMSTQELVPFIYARDKGPAHANATAVDDLFLFGEKHGSLQQPTPYFEKIPEPYNTIDNFTTNFGPTSIYLLATPPADSKTNEHVLCSLKAMQYSSCTTQYRAAQSSSQLSVHCDLDSGNTIPYHKSAPYAPMTVPAPNWKDVGSEWIQAVALSSGVSSANASIARLITQMIPSFDPEMQPATLSRSLPSIGEALGVLAGGTLLLSSADAPFIDKWNYSDTYSYLLVPQYQIFNATLSFKDFASGGTQRWQGIFYIVLMAVFLLNCFALTYLTWQYNVVGQVTDYTEPANLFAMAINSPPSRSMEELCGAEMYGKALQKRWQIDKDVEKDAGNDPDVAGSIGVQEKRPHYYIKCVDKDEKY